MSRSNEKIRLRLKGRGESGRYAGVPTIVMVSHNWKELSGSAVKLLMEFAYQYNGFNNGDLTAAFSILRKRGWRSQNTLNWAVKELIHYGMIIKTRQGTLDKRPNLFALTWRAIDDNNGKMDLCSATNVAPGNWRNVVDIFDRKTAPKLVKRIK
jgi:hypothetical protein